VETYTVQVADGATPVTWYSLIGATAVDPADITAGRILSLPERAALDAADPAPSADNPLTTIDQLLGSLINPPVFGNLPTNGGTPASTYTAGLDGGGPLTHHARISGGAPSGTATDSVDGGAPGTAYAAALDGGGAGSHYRAPTSILSGGQP